MTKVISRQVTPHPLQDFVMDLFTHYDCRIDELDLAYAMAGEVSKTSKYKPAAKDTLERLLKMGVLKKDADGWYSKAAK